MKKLKICIVGVGQFAQRFIPLFKAHPLVEEVSICETLPERLQFQGDRFKIARRFSSYADVIKSDVDAVGLFTQRWMHAPMALEAMNAGKHVYSAVPAATTLEELHQLIETVQRTGLTYMMGETSFYYGARLYCKERWDAGDFGRFVYGEGEYYHDMSHGFYEAYKYSGGDAWKSTASFPPMLYPTHSVSMILSVTGARMSSVSCLGYVDQHEDGVFREDVSLWKNVFSNQTAIFRTDDGGVARINEFRRVGQFGGRSVRIKLYGTEGSFEEQSNGAIWTTRKGPVEDVEDIVKCADASADELREANSIDEALRAEFTSGFGQVHQKYRSRLPLSFVPQANGHEGSHQFLTDDFLTAVVGGHLPTVSIWDAARYNAPGIVAHESALREGELMKIPDFGDAKS